ncbi:MAG: Glu-tRNA(Gln) amidotransferase subunit GatE [Thaumarchaeota archaeon]|nr:Glu-tRNA(Gln) amidotransferase subunit GatE [Candidatus Calditenuaceae archaeon]MDW8187302.1 Glu-tRNA(Gln) amidotransferase subunit GatE [Nitrososphaerota archaeon]
MGLSYRDIGLKVGLEVHRQLNTSHKLFCDCPTDPIESGEKVEYVRRLREAQSELGEVDPAARFEARRARAVVYRADTGNVCLVEMDEEPPHQLNEEALRIALTFARMVGAHPVDEVHVMRKIVIDGSNTTGFQRTCIVATGGSVSIRGKEVPIQTITLEEDAARILEVREDSVVYDLSRLGVPLIEVSTAPVIESPEEALDAAASIGRLLRATQGVKRGIGSVRQDLNISISGGGLIEVKGVQELEEVPKVVEYEVRRLLHLDKVRSELKARGVRAADVLGETERDLTDLLSSSRSRLISSWVVKGGRVMGVRLPGFGGLLGGGDVRLGKELSDYAKAWTGIEGIIHSDELPGYGLTSEEVVAIRTALGAGERDGFAIAVGPERRCREALESVIERAAVATEELPEETRGAKTGGVTIYLRPRPGAARMYPETDVPPTRVTRELLERVEREMPPTLEELAADLGKRYGLSSQLAWELIDTEALEDFRKLLGTGVQPSFVASLLTETMKDLKRSGVRVELIDLQRLNDYLRLIAEGRTAKESAREVLGYLANNPNSSPLEAVQKLGLLAPRLEDVEREVEELVTRLAPKFQDKDPFGPLMGELMRLYRGKVDGAVLSRILREKLKERGVAR